jgi:5-formyltetrahydrofolate cyclo-ligase
LYAIFIIPLQSKIEKLMLFETNIKDLLNLLPGRKLRRAKQRMRELLTQKRRMLPAQERVSGSDLVLQRLEQLPAFQQAKTVLLYYPIQNELDVLPLVKRHKREKTLLFPVSHRRHMSVHPYAGNDMMHRGRFGIPEPTTPSYTGHIDLVVVPAVAFDKKGRRLGRGGGYYDRYIKRLSHTLLVGVGYDFQLVDEVPAARFDQRVNMIILPSQTIQV